MRGGRSATVGVERKVGPLPIKERRNRGRQSQVQQVLRHGDNGRVSDRIGSGPPVLIVRMRRGSSSRIKK
jgi:hypothetical protein